MSWHGHLQLDYRLAPGPGGPCTVALDRHHGPLRVLQRLYPEGPAICHHVLVHPPGGIVGGDVLEVQATLGEGSHALLTTPGATRWYRSEGAAAAQRVQLRLAEGARLEWLPLEGIAYRGCDALNHLTLDLAPGAQMLGWDLLALGLPAAGQGWEASGPGPGPAPEDLARVGRYRQHLSWPGVWLERALIRADDRLLLDSPLGFAGRRVTGLLWFAAGSALAPALRTALLDGARAAIAAAEGEVAATTVGGQVADTPADGQAADITTDGVATDGREPAPGLIAGATSPDPRLVLLRLLAPRVEPALALLKQVRAAWRQAAWALDGAPPRIWRQ